MAAVTVASVLSFLLPAAARAQYASEYEVCGEGPVMSVSVVDCDTKDCRDPDFVSRLISLVDIRVGGYLDPDRIPVALGRVGRLGFFTHADIECVNVGNGVDVRLSVIPVKRISKIKFKGNRHFWDSYLNEKMSLRVGDPFDSANVSDMEFLKSQEKVLRKEYEKDGYAGSEVAIEVVPVDDYSVSLRVTVKEGPRIRLKDVKVVMHRSSRAVEAAAAMSGEVGETGLLEGCPVIRHEDLVKWSGVRRGSPLTEKTQPEIARALVARMRQIGFAGVKVSSKYDELTGVMAIDVSWDSCWLIRIFRRDEPAAGRNGFKPVENDAILEELSFDESGIFDLSEASRGRGSLQRWHEDRGFLFADVVLDYRARPRSEASSGFAPGVAGKIAYFITTGGKAEIRDIRITGNKSVKKADIVAAMATRPYDFFGGTGAVMPGQIATDLEKVRALYRERGFPEMKFNGTIERGYSVTKSLDGDGNDVLRYAGVDSAFDVVVIRDTEGVYLDIFIDEGIHTMVGDVLIAGNGFLSTRQVREIMKLGKGQSFSPVVLDKALRDLGRRYAREGFLNARVTLACDGAGPDIDRDQCNPADVRSEVVNLFLDIDEGQRTMVGEVFIEGAVKTKRSVILKDFPRAGDPYDVEKVSEAIRYLNNLGIFESVRVDVVGADEKPPRDRVGLVVRVREAKSKFIDIAVGLEKLDSTRSADMPAAVSSILTNTVAISDITNTGFGRSLGLNLPDILMTLEVRYSDTNFLGYGKRLYLPVKYGLSFTAWDRYASFTPTYLDPNFFAKGLSFRVTPYAEYDRATKALDRIQFGAEIAISKEFVPRFFGSLSFDTGVIKTRDPAATDRYDPWRYENKLIPSLTWDGLDHPINPTKGFFAQASLSYINDVSEGNYLKYEFSGKAFFSIRKLVTFGFAARIGGSHSFTASGDLPIEERYTLGGNRGLRGFSTDGVAQYNADKSLKLRSYEQPMVDENGDPVLDEGGNQAVSTTWYKPFGGDVVVSGSFEMRFPIIQKIDLFGAVFYDFGALAESFEELSGASFRHSVGVGLRYMLAGVVPIRLDYGIILDRRCKTIDPSTGQCESKDEFGNIHFGILYTF